MMDPRDVGVEPVPVASTDMNCWAASYEVLRDVKLPFAKQKAQIGMFLNLRASDFFSNPNDFFEPVGELKSNQLSIKKSTVELRNQNRKFLDVLALHFQTSVDVAKLKGRFVAGKKNQNQTTWIEFPTGDKVLRLYERPNEFSVGNDSFLDHPGVDGAISVSMEGNPNKGCIREIKHLKGT
jgi:hypothetical protein